MSANLQEMENVVKKGADAGDPMIAGGAQVESWWSYPREL